MQNLFKKILRARVYDVAIESDLQRAHKLSSRLGCEVLLKREDLQRVFSFKVRGSFNKIYQIAKSGTADTVVTASAGNHAQGVALAAQKLGLRALIVMPENSSPLKLEAVKSYGAKAVLHGANFDEASAHARQLCEELNAVFVHAFDDLDIIAGQGTIGMELLRQCQHHIDAIFVPVGGGGLIAGIGAYIKSLYPEVKIIGVEPIDAASMQAALNANQCVTLEQMGLFADGVAVGRVGEETLRIAKEVIDECIQVTTDEVCAAIKDIYDDARAIAEPAGAVATAGLKKYAQIKNLQDQRLIAIVSGANMNFDRLRYVAESAEVGEQREMLIGVKLPEKPGSFKRFCAALGKRNVTEFNYRFADSDSAYVFAGVELKQGNEEKQQIIQRLVDKKYQVTDLSDNDMAKHHLRYMIGGKPQNVGRERLLRFEFPEQLGALNHFLNTLGARFNISLFHYRNHGAAFGRVLVGLQVSEQDDAELDQYLQELGYSYVEESQNPALAMFLRD